MTLRPIPQRGHDAPIRGMFLEILKVQRRRTLSVKHIRDPRVRIIEVPHGGPDTSLDLDAGADGGLVVPALLRQVRRVGGQVEADVQLRLRDLDARRHEVLQVLDLLVQAGRRPDDQMRLRAHAVDLDAALLQAADQALHRRALRPGRLEVVVVVVQLRVRVGRGGGLERERDVLGPDDVVEDGRAVRAVLVEGLVDDVPGVAAALPVLGDLRDVVDEDGGEALGRPVAAVEPVGCLGVPD